PTLSTLFPYTTLFRSSSVFRCAPGSGRCSSHAEDRAEVREVSELVAGRRDPGRKRGALRIDPCGVHPDLLGPKHVDVGAVADEEDRKSTRLNSSHVAI